jgi:hypothetical protein
MGKPAGTWVVVAVLAMGSMQASASMPSPPGIAIEDDLAVVKRAVASTQTVEPTPRPKASEGVVSTAEPRKKGDKPQWLRVRIVEKGSKKGKVSVNLPLSLVRALGDDMPLDLPCSGRDRDDGERRHKDCTIKIGDILQALDTGQDLVEVDDDESTIRVWVE